jgi:hypothetical protein
LVNNLFLADDLETPSPNIACRNSVEAIVLQSKATKRAFFGLDNSKWQTELECFFLWPSGNYTPGPIKTSPDSALDVFFVIPVICFGYQVGCHSVKGILSGLCLRSNFFLPTQDSIEVILPELALEQTVLKPGFSIPIRFLWIRIHL